MSRGHGWVQRALLIQLDEEAERRQGPRHRHAGSEAVSKRQAMGMEQTGERSDRHSVAGAGGPQARSVHDTYSGDSAFGESRLRQRVTGRSQTGKNTDVSLIV